MTPNQRERALETALGWLRFRTRAGDYVKVYGWSRVLIADSTEECGALLAVLTGFERETGEALVITDVNDRRKRLSGVSAGELRAAIARPNRYDSSLGGASVASESRSISLVIEWTSTLAPRTTFLGTVQERWLDMPRHVSTLKSTLESLAATCRCEYLISSHVSDEVSKLSAGQPRYEGAPGAGIPYVPWLMLMGPEYVEVVGRQSLEALGDAISWHNAFASIATSPNPLLYGTPKVRESEERIRRLLGQGLFTTSREGERTGPAYPREYLVGPGASAETWDAYPDGDRVRVVVSRRGGSSPDG